MSKQQSDAKDGDEVSEHIISRSHFLQLTFAFVISNHARGRQICAACTASKKYGTICCFKVYRSFDFQTSCSAKLSLKTRLTRIRVGNSCIYVADSISLTVSNRNLFQLLSRGFRYFPGGVITESAIQPSSTKDLAGNTVPSLPSIIIQKNPPHCLQFLNFFISPLPLDVSCYPNGVQ